LEPKILKIELSKKEDLVRAIVFANPDQRVHLLFTNDRFSWIFYGNSKEFVFTRDRLEEGCFAFEHEELRKVERMDRVGPIYIFNLKVSSSDFDGVIP